MKQLRIYLKDTNKLKRLTPLLLVVFMIAAIGTYLLTSSHAASPYASTTASKGNLAGGATEQTCSGASIGTCVTFSQSVPMDGSVALALSQPGTPFAASSFWNTPLPDNTPVNPNTPAYIDDINADLCLHPEQTSSSNPCLVPNYGTLNISQYSAPLYVVPANQPYVPVNGACGNPKPGTDFTSPPRYAQDVLAGGIPIPADAHAAVGTDEEIQIYQPSTDTYWDMWQAQQDSSGAWQSCFGGVISGVSQSDGIFPDNFGATATSLPLLGGVVRIEELQAGQIDHVMGIQLASNLCPYVEPQDATSCTRPTQGPYYTTSGISWPATRSDGTNLSALAIPEGLRLRLPPNSSAPGGFNLNNYSLSPVAKVIAVAAQKYGFVVYDTDPNGVNIRLGDPTTYTNNPSPNLPNPYTSGPGVGGVGDEGLLNGSSQSQIMKNFPWSQLQALPFNYGEPTIP
jgi:hypothetical protein